MMRASKQLTAVMRKQAQVAAQMLYQEGKLSEGLIYSPHLLDEGVWPTPLSLKMSP